MPKTSQQNPNTPADASEHSLRALAAVQVALDRRDNGGDASAARDREAARAASA
ncbi:MAG TPA: hypothetical protein VK162_09465 [Streptosporangiaceae bacterium]|nr:hypothetical protein [Streptosporangiaceae bacterium]